MLALQHHVADPPAPARQPVDELERSEQLVARRGATAPSAHSCVAEPDPGARRQREHRVERGQAEVPAGRAGLGDHQQPVVAAGAQPADGAHRVAAEPVGHQPLPRRSGRQIPHTCAPNTTMAQSWRQRVAGASDSHKIIDQGRIGGPTKGASGSERAWGVWGGAAPTDRGPQGRASWEHRWEPERAWGVWRWRSPPRAAARRDGELEQTSGQSDRAQLERNICDGE